MKVEEIHPDLKHILAPTDFSTFSLVGLEAAIGMAKLMPQSTVTLVHALEGNGLSVSAYTSVPWYEDLEKKAAAAKEELGRLKANYEADFPLQTRLLRGAPSHVICDMVQNELFDLVVVSSHGLTGMARLLIGSVAERLLSVACSVMVVKPPKDENGELAYAPVDLKFNNILVGYDHRPGARQALAMGRKLATLTGAHMTVIQVVEPPNYLLSFEVEGHDDFTADRVKQVVAQLEQVRSRYQLGTDQWEFKVLTGHPWESLTEYALANQSDLILIGDHEHSRWGHGFVGSTAQRVVRIAGCPVMVVKAGSGLSH